MCNSISKCIFIKNCTLVTIAQATNYDLKLFNSLKNTSNKITGYVLLVKTKQKKLFT